MNKENLTAYEVVTEENLTDIHSTGWLLRHKSTLCSRICATPVLSLGGVRNAILNTLFSSSFSISITLAPVFLWRRSQPVEWISVRFSSVTTS